MFLHPEDSVAEQLELVNLFHSTPHSTLRRDWQTCVSQVMKLITNICKWAFLRKTQVVLIAFKGFLKMKSGLITPVWWVFLNVTLPWCWSDSLGVFQQWRWSISVKLWSQRCWRQWGLTGFLGDYLELLLLSRGSGLLLFPTCIPPSSQGGLYRGMYSQGLLHCTLPFFP